VGNFGNHKEGDVERLVTATTCEGRLTSTLSSSVAGECGELAGFCFWKKVKIPLVGLVAEFLQNVRKRATPTGLEPVLPA
jgi:hypothetical protein